MMDLTGKLIIKVQLGDDIRRIPIHNEDITFDELMLMMQRVYRGKLTSTDDVQIKYKDEDGDLVTIFDSTDLSFAIQCSRILRLTLIVNGEKTQSAIDTTDIRGELQSIRNLINAIIDKTGVSLQLGQGKTPLEHATGSEQSDVPVTALQPAYTQNMAVKPAQPSSKEFDPLSGQGAVDNTQSKVAASFGLPNDAVAASGRLPDRADTPDSQSSLGSASQRADPQQYGQRQVHGYGTQFTSQAQVQTVQPSINHQSLGQTSPYHPQSMVNKPGPPTAYNATQYQTSTNQANLTQEYSSPAHPSQVAAAQQQPQSTQQMGISNQPYTQSTTQQSQIPGPPSHGFSVANVYQPQSSSQLPQGVPQPSVQYTQQPGVYPGFQQPVSGGIQDPSMQQAGYVPPIVGTNPYSHGPGAGYGMARPRQIGSYQQGYR